MKPRLLCILHRSPPAHGAAKVGDFIASSKKLNDAFDCRFITIKSSETIGEIGTFNVKKIYYVVELYLKVLLALLVFRPHKIYYTASIVSIAFYRDLLVSTLWKGYRIFFKTDVYYHYHTKGINNFISSSNINKQLTRFFIKNVNLVLLSPALKDDFINVQSYKDILYLPNGVENTIEDGVFESYVEKKYEQVKAVNILYLSNMIKSKGYFHVLELANMTKDENYHYHFAGGWQNAEDEKDFFDYIEQQGLSDHVTFHGFVSGVEKQKLLEAAHLFIFPTRYKNEAFPLSILEALSYGVPVIATDEASIPHILSEDTGIVMNNRSELLTALHTAREKLIDKESAVLCRQVFLSKFSSEQFENTLLATFSN